ncbi:MAG: hypothetical protein H6Q10_2460, partial [Acidobacteria bacterium]|nr:hypothetical protein [Acidobacteriota bacterium]
LLGGSWQGNDTVWRMVIDINRIARYGGRDGRLHVEPRRSLYHFVDGIVAGEGEGPLRSTPRDAGLFLHGTDAVVLDALAAALMGFDPDAVPLVRHAFHRHHGLTTVPSLPAARVLLDRGLRLRLSRGQHFGFQPPRGWPGLASSVPAALLHHVASPTPGRGLPEPFPDEDEGGE